MPGSPLKRAKREQQSLAAVGHDGQPLKPLTPCRALPAEWLRWSDSDKIRHLFGMSLERAHDYLSLTPVETLDPHLQASQREAMRLLIVTTREIALTSQRAEERQRIVQQIAAAVSDTGARAVIAPSAAAPAAPRQHAADDGVEHGDDAPDVG